jgi:hypothetical protein
MIYGWEGSIWDLSPALNPDDQSWTVILEPEHCQWLLDLHALDAGSVSASCTLPGRRTPRRP